MPVVTFYLVANSYTDTQYERLATESCHILAEVLDTPIDRTRAFISLYPRGLAAVAGEMLPEGSGGAPFFHFYIGSRRPKEHRPVVLARLTDLLVDALGVDRSLIRGYADPTEAEDWGVAGVPLNLARAAEFQPAAPDAQAG